MTYDDIINNIPHSGSTQLLVKLFGGQIYNIFNFSTQYSGPQETLLSIFGTMMSGVALWMFLFVVMYVALTGMVNQAQSGDFMLKNWNSIWSFLRLGMGITAVVPFPGTGLVTMQAFVIAIAMMSSSIADITWGKILDKAAQAGITAQQGLAPTIDPAKTNAYLNDAFNYSSCVANKVKYSSPDESVSLDTINPINPGDNPTVSAIASVCGGEKFQAFLKVASTITPPSPPDLTPQPDSDLISSNTLVKFNAYQKQQYDYLTDTTIVDFLQNRIWPFYINNMDQLTSGTLPDSLVAQWLEIANEFSATLQNKIQSAIAANKAMAAQVFSNQASQYGWVSAGNYYRQLAQQQQIVGSAISASLENSPDYVNLNQESDLTVSDNMTSFGVDNSQSLLNRALTTAKQDGSKYVLDPLGLDVFQTGETTDPILAMTNFGQKLEGSAEALIVARQVPALFSWIPVIGNKINQLFSGGIINILVGLTAIAGLILGTILPSMPWIIFLFAVLSWLIYVAEMFVAAPFWIVANAAPEGQTFVSSLAKKGINNILFITLFPTLAIGGLVASIAISWVGMSLVNHFIYIGFKPLWGIGTFPMTFIGMVYIYVMLAWTVMVSSLNLIQEFPRKILTWISLSEPGLSPFENAHEGIQGGIVGAQMTGAISQTLGTLSQAESGRATKGAIASQNRALRKSLESEKSE